MSIYWTDERRQERRQDAGRRGQVQARPAAGEVPRALPPPAGFSAAVGFVVWGLLLACLAAAYLTP